MLWFILFSIVPLAFITGYSVVKYEQAIDKEQLQRLEGNYREVVSILTEFEAELVAKVKAHAQNNSLAYYLNNKQTSQVAAIARSWLQNTLAHRLSIYSREGRLEVALFKDLKGEIQKRALENKEVFLSPEFIELVNQGDVYRQIEIPNRNFIELIAVTKIRNNTGRTVGYIEEIIELDKTFIEGLKSRMNLELAFYLNKSLSPGEKKYSEIFASHEDLDLYKPDYFETASKDKDKKFFELNIRDVPFGFILRSLKWGDNELYIAIGTSKKAVKTVLRTVNYAFYSVVGGIIVLLILLSIIISKILLRPVSRLVEAFQQVQPGDVIPEVKDLPENELGVLADNFNKLSQRVNKAQEELKNKISELENANQEIRDTQAKLVHSAKMASLGQLVAGVAHELNNPIGFIYSNMGHLSEYSKSLIKIVEAAEQDPKSLQKVKAQEEFDYIVSDMPKLIKSCEEGAKRTRDIVLGLRNFSRLEEAKLKEVNIEDSIDNTLNLLSGELKNRINIVKNYSGVPLVNCYPSQLNQVFMNILSNAAQAIDGNGELVIATREVAGDKVEISISDTGKGMSQETIDKIFDPFFTTKTLGKGTGLGLSISYGIIQKHNGDIQVHSEVGKGTEFILTLPIQGPIS
ncbi:MAG: HAMP domain-containing protein [Bdellovibrionales bacterium]|nr:HAMP domain-containing protein [Bdellovibrionales bacterium]